MAYTDPLRAAWYSQLKSCENRTDSIGNPIRFYLTFEEWIQIWEQSGKLNSRGKRKGEYVMARYNDTGDYAVNNVFITTMEHNTYLGNKGRKHDAHTNNKKSKSLKGNPLLMGRIPWNKGIPRDAQTKLKISQGVKLNNTRKTGAYR